MNDSRTQLQPAVLLFLISILVFLVFGWHRIHRLYGTAFVAFQKAGLCHSFRKAGIEFLCPLSRRRFPADVAGYATFEYMKWPLTNVVKTRASTGDRKGLPRAGLAL